MTTLLRRVSLVAKALLILLLSLGLVEEKGQERRVIAFSPPLPTTTAAVTQKQKITMMAVRHHQWRPHSRTKSRQTGLFLASDEKEESSLLSKKEQSSSSSSTSESSAVSATATTTTNVQETSAIDSSSENNNNNNKYPLDIPSPILLASSMVLAIASVGTYDCRLSIVDCAYSQ